MSTWCTKSFTLVSKGGYLDKLSSIYTAPEPLPLSLSKSLYNRIESALNQPNDYALLECLLNLDRFPFNDPYVSFLRKNPQAINDNPNTVARLCSRLRQMGITEVVKGLEEPKQFNRQMGQLFRKWITSNYSSAKDENSFINSNLLIFLDASGEKLRQFANQIGCGLQKQPDFVAKHKNRYIVGEAKFIGTEGGNQNRAFDDALNLASRSYPRAVTVAVLDGIIWLPDSGQMSRRLNNFSGNALTALLLDDFLSSL